MLNVGCPPRRIRMQAVKEYDARIDIKKRVTKRVTKRGVKYDNYRELEYSNGTMVLEPGALVAPFKISRNTLEMMDSVMENIRKGKVSSTVDLNSFSTE